MCHSVYLLLSHPELSKNRLRPVSDSVGLSSIGSRLTWRKLVAGGAETLGPRGASAAGHVRRAPLHTDAGVQLDGQLGGQGRVLRGGREGQQQHRPVEVGEGGPVGRQVVEGEKEGGLWETMHCRLCECREGTSWGCCEYTGGGWGGGGGAKPSDVAAPLRSCRRLLNFSPFAKINKAAAVAHRLCFPIGGGSWHQRMDGSTRQSSSVRSAHTSLLRVLSWSPPPPQHLGPNCQPPQCSGSPRAGELSGGAP